MNSSVCMYKFMEHRKFMVISGLSMTGSMDSVNILSLILIQQESKGREGERNSNGATF